jgi:hemolysin-activating ACP:hemolysin acyltransferase
MAFGFGRKVKSTEVAATAAPPPAIRAAGPMSGLQTVPAVVPAAASAPLTFTTPAAAQSASLTNVPAQSPAARAALSGTAARNAAHSRRMSTMLGDIVSVFAQSPQHTNLQLGDLSKAVLPALAAGQYKIAVGQDDATGYSRPIAAIVWARVSDAVDQRLISNVASRLNLGRDDWTSGNHIWIIDAAGAREALTPLLVELRRTVWGQAPVKFRQVSEAGAAVVGTLAS